MTAASAYDNLPVQTGELIRLYNRSVRGVHEDATYDDDRAYGGVSANRNQRLWKL